MFQMLSNIEMKLEQNIQYMKKVFYYMDYKLENMGTKLRKYNLRKITISVKILNRLHRDAELHKVND